LGLSCCRGFDCRLDNVLVRGTRVLTEPALGPLRRFLPSFGGFDISPLLLLVLLPVIRSLLVG
jgi:uncharacterized protein YggT (Ycf19 family)